MINIYCTLDCAYQKEGLCTLQKINYTICSLKTECAYYEKKENRSKYSHFQ